MKNDLPIGRCVGAPEFVVSFPFSFLFLHHKLAPTIVQVSVPQQFLSWSLSVGQFISLPRFCAVFLCGFSNGS